MNRNSNTNDSLQPLRGVLQDILTKKLVEVEKLTGLDPTSYPPHHEARSFSGAIRRSPGTPLRIIAECKKASPSKGLIRPDYQPEAIAKEYARLGASALSVLTERNFFQGDPAHIQLARKSGLPVIRKDFLTSEKQLFETASLGADAALLIVRLLSQSQLKDFLEIAASLKLDILVEVHNQREAETAVESGAKIIGINHRDLDTLEMDMSISAKIAPEIRKHSSDTIIVAESGVESKEGYLQVESYADAILIGTALMSSPDIEQGWKRIFS